MSCQVCQKKGKTKICSFCHTGAYCGKICQREHYFEHQFICERLRLFRNVDICGADLQKQFRLLRKNFKIFDLLPDILCDVTTWKTYSGSPWDLFMLSKLILTNSGPMKDQSIEVNLIRELMGLGAKSMITSLENNDKLCFSRRKYKGRVMQIGKQLNKLTHKPDNKSEDTINESDNNDTHINYIQSIFDYELLCFPQWAREELWKMWQSVII